MLTTKQINIIKLTITKALLIGAHDAVCEAADMLFAAGLELEEIGLDPWLLERTSSVLILKNWKPKTKE